MTAHRPTRPTAAPKALLLVAELEDYAIAFANGLSRHASVVLGVPQRRYARLADAIDPAVDLRLLDWPRHRSPANLRLLVELARLTRRERPDVVHLLSNTTLWLNLAMPFWRATKLVTVHDVEVHPGDTDTRVLPAWACDLAVRQADDVVVHGDALRQRAIARFGLAPERVHVLPHPALPRYGELAARLGLRRRTAPGVFNVLMFGRLFAYKGLADLVRAEALIGPRVPGLRITVAGRGDDVTALGDLMGDPRRYDVRRGHIEDAEVAQLFLDADLVALPYTEASQSGVLNVAAAFGRPVVATDVGELGTTVRRHGLGLVVPPSDPARLADAIAALAVPAAAENFGRAALAWTTGENSPETVGAAAAVLYRRLLARSAATVAPAAAPAPEWPAP